MNIVTSRTFIVGALLLGTAAIALVLGGWSALRSEQTSSSVEDVPEITYEPDWRGSTQGIVAGLNERFITLRDENGKGMHALISEDVRVRKTTLKISGESNEVAWSLQQIEIGDTAIVLMQNENGSTQALDINIVEVVTTPRPDEGISSEDS